MVMLYKSSLIRTSVFRPLRRFDAVLLNPQPLPPRLLIR